MLKNWNTNSIVYHWTRRKIMWSRLSHLLLLKLSEEEKNYNTWKKNHCFDDRNNSILGVGALLKKLKQLFSSFFFSFHFCVFWSLNKKTKKIDHCRLTLQDRPSLCFFPLLFPFGVSLLLNVPNKKIIDRKAKKQLQILDSLKFAFRFAWSRIHPQLIKQLHILLT